MIKSWIPEGIPSNIHTFLHAALLKMAQDKDIELNITNHLDAYTKSYPDANMPSYDQMCDAMNLIADYMIGYDS